MAVKVGHVGIPGATGNFSVTGLGFVPVGVIFFNQFDHQGLHSWMFGASSGPGEEWALWTGTSTEISGYNARNHEGRTDRCCLQYTGGGAGTVAWACSMVSLDADGFTLNLTDRTSVNGGEGGLLYYMAIGGDKITAAHAGSFIAGTSTGQVSVTAPGFLPNACVFGHVGDAALDGGYSARMQIGTGLTDGLAQYSSFVRGNTGTAISVGHISRSDAVACCYDGTNTFRMEFDSWDANGFTVDVTDAWTGDLEHCYFAIQAEVAVAGYGTQPSSSTSVQYDTPDLLPGGVFFCWPGVDTESSTGSSTAPLRPGVAAMTDTASRHSSGIFRDSAAFGVFTSDAYQERESVMFKGAGNGIIDPPAHNEVGKGDFSSFDEGSFTLDWTVLDSNARPFGWLALPGEVLGWMPQIYRYVIFRGGQGGGSNTGGAPGYGPGNLEAEPGGSFFLLEDGTGFIILEEE